LKSFKQESDGDIILQRELSAARGITKAEMVLKNADIVNIFTETIEHADIAICDGIIVGIGTYEGEYELDCTGTYAVPGFIDGHIHLESSMLKPVEFAKAVLIHGTTAVITDPHEIANVCGTYGMEYMMEASEGLPLDVYFTLPSCVPATSFDESGYRIGAGDLKDYYSRERVVGLAEVMDYISTIHGDKEILDKIADAKLCGKIVDGHAPGLHGKEACAYVAAGIESDHECISFEEAREKLSLGQWIMIREGTAAKNLDALMGLFQAPFYQRAMLVSDDKHPYDLLEYGHMDDLLRRAVSKGADPCIAIKMASYHTANYFGLKATGAIAPGYKADIVILENLKEFKVVKVIKNGKLIVTDQKAIKIREPEIKPELLHKVYNSVNCKELVSEDFVLKMKETPPSSGSFRVIQFMKGEIGTKEIRKPLVNGIPKISLEEDILKIAAVERHHNTGHIGIGFVLGYGLKKGAIASSVSHDSHNIIVIGTNDEDIAVAANSIRQMQGGFAIAAEGKVLSKLPLPIAGLMSDLDAVSLAEKINEMKTLSRRLGVSEGIDPFMTLAFVSLPVIPELRLLTTGLFDVKRQELVPVII
jgi:adenine deaminase